MANLPTIPWLESLDFLVWDDQIEMRRYQGKIDIKLRSLSDSEITNLVAFLHALSGHSAKKLRFGIPNQVPSGLNVDK